MSHISDFLSEKEIDELKNKPFIYHQNLLIRRVDTPHNIFYFFSREMEIMDELYRDILRFFLINIIILVPLYFLVRLHIRRIL